MAKQKSLTPDQVLAKIIARNIVNKTRLSNIDNEIEVKESDRLLFIRERNIEIVNKGFEIEELKKEKSDLQKQIVSDDETIE